ncbi:MAG: biopolymer transporter ExbD [Pseudomonadota bacterium]|nr:biopolymer transporter ExbD [Pseudomonadota bacterium]
MRFKRNIRADVHIDLTSLIDVVFILLLFFILTTTFSRNTSLIVNLPEASGETTTDGPLRIDVSVDSAGAFAVNGRRLENNSVATLMQAISDLSAGDNSLPITITADAATTHQSVVTAMDAVAQLGFTKLSIATRNPGTE